MANFLTQSDGSASIVAPTSSLNTATFTRSMSGSAPLFVSFVRTDGTYSVGTSTYGPTGAFINGNLTTSSLTVTGALNVSSLTVGALTVTGALSITGPIVLGSSSYGATSAIVNGNITGQAGIFTTSLAVSGIGAFTSTLTASSLYTTAGANINGPLSNATTGSFSSTLRAAGITSTTGITSSAGINVGGALFGATTGYFGSSVQVGTLTSLGGISVGGALSNVTGTITLSASTPIAFSGTGANTVTSASNSSNSAFVFNASGGTTGDIFDFQLAGTKKAAVLNVGTFYSAVAANSGNPALSFPNNAGGSNLTYLQSSSGITIAGVAGTILRIQGVGLSTNDLITVDAYGNMGMAGLLSQASHSSLKTDIKKLDFDSLDIIKQTKIIKFKYKNNPDVEHIGFLADEVPDEVSPDHEGHNVARTLSIAYDAIKQLTARVEALEQEK